MATTREARGSRQYRRLYVDMINSPQWTALSGNAVKLVIDCLARYRDPYRSNGKLQGNNGDFDFTDATMKARGWNSIATVRRARDELVDAGFLRVTRQGDRRRPSLYGFTFEPIDECGGKLDCRPTRAASNDWKRR